MGMEIKKELNEKEVNFYLTNLNTQKKVLNKLIHDISYHSQNSLNFLNKKRHEFIQVEHEQIIEDNFKQSIKKKMEEINKYWKKISPTGILPKDEENQKKCSEFKREEIEKSIKIIMDSIEMESLEEYYCKNFWRFIKRGKILYEAEIEPSQDKDMKATLTPNFLFKDDFFLAGHMNKYQYV
ncbi:MAG: hypothetical protein MJ252_29810, partial [archaeon]|nr:hypothetical protein [archaeon]